MMPGAYIVFQFCVHGYVRTNVRSSLRVCVHMYVWDPVKLVEPELLTAHIFQTM